MLKTVKFGGSSLADAAQFKKAQAILSADESRRYVVVSAPGKRFDGDEKITDLLYQCCSAAAHNRDFSPIFEKVCRRFEEIIQNLGLDLDLSRDFSEISGLLRAQPDADFAASRGEYLSARVMAALLDVPMIDAAECVFFDEVGLFDAQRTQQVLSARLAQCPRAVLPGFYGRLPDGRVHTFSRGGSDITGAIVARACGADLYENWTDVSGLLCCDPRIVQNPSPIPCISYTELRELSYMGASVLHEAAIFPVKTAGIPINIRNTNDPDAPGTLIAADAAGDADHPVTGIAGRRDFSAILIEKEQMNETAGFAMRVLQVLYKYGLLLEHMPTGIDTLSVVVPTQLLEPHRDALLREIQQVTQADSLSVQDNLTMIAIVGRGMVRRQGVSGRVFAALSRAGINVNMIDQGSSELNIIVGVDTADFEPAINALYTEFFGQACSKRPA